jgi:hypothetical protein
LHESYLYNFCYGALVSIEPNAGIMFDARIDIDGAISIDDDAWRAAPATRIARLCRVTGKYHHASAWRNCGALPPFWIEANRNSLSRHGDGCER